MRRARRAVGPAEVVRLYVEERLTQAQIAARCRISQPTVARRLEAAGALAARRRTLDPIPDEVDPEDRRKLLYIREQVAGGHRGDRDVEMLVAVYRDVLRRRPQDRATAPRRVNITPEVPTIGWERTHAQNASHRVRSR